MKRIKNFFIALWNAYKKHVTESRKERINRIVSETSEIRSVSDKAYIEGSYVFVAGVPIAKIVTDNKDSTMYVANNNYGNCLPYKDALSLLSGINALHYSKLMSENKISKS